MSISLSAENVKSDEYSDCQMEYTKKWCSKLIYFCRAGKQFTKMRSNLNVAVIRGFPKFDLSNLTNKMLKDIAKI